MVYRYSGVHNNQHKIIISIRKLSFTLIAVPKTPSCVCSSFMIPGHDCVTVHRVFIAHHMFVWTVMRHDGVSDIATDYSQIHVCDLYVHAV